MFSMSLDDLDIDTLNEPLPLAGGAGLSGPRHLSLSPAEVAKRRGSMEALLINGVSDEDITRVMNAEHGMTDQETEDLRVAVAEAMLHESATRGPYKKAMAEKRLHQHIAKAAKRNAWGAVAVLEGQLARVQGTEVPTETKVTVDARLQTATLHVLAALPQEQVDALIAEELARGALPAKVG